MRIDREWMVHRLETSVDFARDNRLLTWYLGGLNFKVERHLFPRPAASVTRPSLPIVEATCRAYGIPHRSHRDHAQRVSFARSVAQADGGKIDKVGIAKLAADAEAQPDAESQPGLQPA